MPFNAKSTAPIDPSLLGIDCGKLNFAFAEGQETVLTDVDLKLEQGSRCLLVGANGGMLGRESSCRVRVQVLIWA